MFPISSYSTRCVCDITSGFQGCVQGSQIGGGHASVTRPRNSKTGADHAPSRPLSYLKLQNAFTEFLYHRPFGAASTTPELLIPFPRTYPSHPSRNSKIFIFSMSVIWLCCRDSKTAVHTPLVVLVLVLVYLSGRKKLITEKPGLSL